MYSRDVLELLRPFIAGKNSSLFDTSDEFVVCNNKLRIDLKGAKKENVSLIVEGNVIKVVATKKNLHDKTTKFERSFVLGDAYDPETIKATYEDSILEITSELYETKKPKEIKIE